MVGQQPFGGARLSGSRFGVENSVHTISDVHKLNNDGAKLRLWESFKFTLLISISGTNDKAGGPHYMLKWASPQSVKQTFVPLRDVEYPYMKK